MLVSKHNTAAAGCRPFNRSLVPCSSRYAVVSRCEESSSSAKGSKRQIPQDILDEYSEVPEWMWVDIDVDKLRRVRDRKRLRAVLPPDGLPEGPYGRKPWGEWEEVEDDSSPTQQTAEEAAPVSPQEQGPGASE